MTDEQSTAGDEQGVQPDITTDDGVTDPTPASNEAEKGKHTAKDMQTIIVDSFKGKLASGDLTLEDIRGGDQAWVADRIELESMKAPEEETLSEDALTQKILTKVSIDNTWRDINSLGLSAEKLKEIRATEDQYQQLGPKEALDIALKIAGVDTSVHAMRRRGMRLPTVGDGVTDNAIVISDDDRRIAKASGSTPEKVAEKRKAATVKR